MVDLNSVKLRGFSAMKHGRGWEGATQESDVGCDVQRGVRRPTRLLVCRCCL